ncbi:hypothetical protein TNCV_2171211 [Trichonephila clavipes]|nr:hypothetical protein TNCV_2171211 [Trichonephila clavipes]
MSNWAWMKKRATHSMLLHVYATFHQPYSLKRGGRSVSQTPMTDQMFVMGDRPRDPAYQGNNRILYVSRKLPSQRVQTCSIGERSVTWQAMVGRHILEDIVGRVVHTKDDRVSQEIAPHTVTPCEIAVCRSTINAGSDRLRLQTRVRWSSALRLNRDSSLDTSPVCHTPLPEVGKNPVDTAYDVGSVVNLSGRRLLKPTSVSRLLMVSLDGTGCLEGGNAMSDVVGAEVATLLIARSSRSFVFLGRPDPPRRYTLPSVIHCCQHRATYRSPRWRPIRLFDQPASLRPIIWPPIKVRHLLVLPPVTS